MKIPGIVLILIVGLSTNSALAQKADSVIIIYESIVCDGSAQVCSDIMYLVKVATATSS